MKELRITAADRERFWTKVDQAAGCWVWTAARHPTGYGSFGLSGASVYAHRVAWVIANNKQIPKDMVIRHECDNPPCVRPSHLVLPIVGQARES